MIIAPSLLASNFARFGKEAARTQKSGAEWLHLDIMYGHFVSNISFGPEVVRSVRSFAKKMVFDVHLMCSRPEILLEPFVERALSLSGEPELGLLPGRKSTTDGRERREAKNFPQREEMGKLH